MQGDFLPLFRWRKISDITVTSGSLMPTRSALEHDLPSKWQGRGKCEGSRDRQIDLSDRDIPLSHPRKQLLHKNMVHPM